MKINTLNIKKYFQDCFQSVYEFTNLSTTCFLSSKLNDIIFIYEKKN